MHLPHRLSAPPPSTQCPAPLPQCPSHPPSAPPPIVPVPLSYFQYPSPSATPLSFQCPSSILPVSPSIGGLKLRHRAPVWLSAAWENIGQPHFRSEIDRLLEDHLILLLIPFILMKLIFMMLCNSLLS